MDNYINSTGSKPFEVQLDPADLEFADLKSPSSLHFPTDGASLRSHNSTAPIMSEKHDDQVLPISTPTTATGSHSQAGVNGGNPMRKEISVFMGEFIGTFMFLFIAFTGTQISLESASIKSVVPEITQGLPEVSKLLYIAFSFGASLAVNVAIFGDVSGGMFNPAVTTALWIIGMVRWPRALHSIFAQLLAGICASAVVSALLPGPLPVATRLDPSMSITRGLFLEMFLTAQLILTILMLPGSSAKPMYIGVSLFLGHICGVFFTGTGLNPARSFGPSVVTGFDGYHWIYWLGPILGAGLASATFMLVNLVKGENLTAHG